MLRVTYVWHSCFVVELDHHILVFDYFPKEAVETVHFEGKMPELDANKHIYVFASHSHKDHFSLEVLHWKEKYPKINYIFSKDIRLGRAYLMRHGIDPAIKKEIQFVSVNMKSMISSLRHCVPPMQAWHIWFRWKDRRFIMLAICIGGIPAWKQNFIRKHMGMRINANCIV